MIDVAYAEELFQTNLKLEEEKRKKRPPSREPPRRLSDRRNHREGELKSMLKELTMRFGKVEKEQDVAAKERRELNAKLDAALRQLNRLGRLNDERPNPTRRNPTVG